MGRLQAAAVIGVLSMVGCAEVGDVTSSRPSVELEEGGLPSSPDWQHDDAVGVDPCGGGARASCSEDTLGACGVVALPGESSCVPLFNWGVGPDGEVTFASSERVFAIEDLVEAPLGPGELAEAQALREELEAISSQPPEAEGDLEPLASSITIPVDHSGQCSTSWTLCDWNHDVYWKYAYHYYSGSRHYHVLRKYRSYGCINLGSLLYTKIYDCTG